MFLFWEPCYRFLTMTVLLRLMIWLLWHRNFLNMLHSAICLNGLDLSDKKSDCKKLEEVHWIQIAFVCFLLYYHILNLWPWFWKEWNFELSNKNICSNFLWHLPNLPKYKTRLPFSLLPVYYLRNYRLPYNHITGCLTIAYKVKHVLYNHFPENWR